jgi:quercetin dioxygenase-like cupin family protein
MRQEKKPGGGAKVSGRVGNGGGTAPVSQAAAHTLPVAKRYSTPSQKASTMSDTTIIKVDSAHSPTGADGEKYLASGKHVAMRMWENEQPGEPKAPATRTYETVGYVLSGKAELHLAGQVAILETGNSWVVPANTEHTYKILETFTAVEATSPPAQVHGREEK